MNEDSRYDRPRIILVDDHPISRYGLCAAIRVHSMGVVVAEASSVNELFDALEKKPCDVVIADFVMPNSYGADGLVMVRRLVHDYPEIGVVVITSLRNRGLLKETLYQGAKGWVDKGSDHIKLALAVREASVGRIYVADAGPVGGVSRDVYSGKKKRLTKIEASIIHLTVYESMKLGPISRLLRCSYKSASRYKRSALLKLSLNNEQELYEYCRWVDMRVPIA